MPENPRNANVMWLRGISPVLKTICLTFVFPWKALYFSCPATIKMALVELWQKLFQTHVPVIKIKPIMWWFPNPNSWDNFHGTEPSSTKKLTVCKPLSKKMDSCVCLKTLCAHIFVFGMGPTSWGCGESKESRFLVWSCCDLKDEQGYSRKGERDVAGTRGKKKAFFLTAVGGEKNRFMRLSPCADPEHC